jgi:uncharacterized delta-60 repeat protein
MIQANEQRGRLATGGRALIPAVVVAFAMTSLLAAGSSPAAFQVGALDRSFSRDGKVMTAFPEETGEEEYIEYRLPYGFHAGRLEMAVSPTGQVVVASSRELVRYSPNGQLDLPFGEGGRIALPHAADSRFQLADIAIDSRGRLLVAGTTKPRPPRLLRRPDRIGPIVSSVTLLRYESNGGLDPNFAIGGALTSDLGIPQPAPLGWDSNESAVTALGIAVDSLDRPVLTGRAVTSVYGCTYGGIRYSETTRAFVARLTEGGEPDVSFADNGVRLIRDIGTLSEPAVTSERVLSWGRPPYFAPCPRGASESPSIVAAVGAEGSPDPTFGDDGLWNHFFSYGSAFFEISKLAVAPSGKILLLGRESSYSFAGLLPEGIIVLRLLPDGSLDPRFGRRGQFRLRLSRREDMAAIAADAHDRVLLAGTVRAKLRSRFARPRFLLIRTTPKGELDRSFGRGGRVITGFGGRAKSHAAHVVVDHRGRIVLGGPVVSPRLSTPFGFGIARHLSGS